MKRLYFFISIVVRFISNLLVNYFYFIKIEFKISFGSGVVAIIQILFLILQIFLVTLFISSCLFIWFNFSLDTILGDIATYKENNSKDNLILIPDVLNSDNQVDNPQIDNPAIDLNIWNLVDFAQDQLRSIVVSNLSANEIWAIKEDLDLFVEVIITWAGEYYADPDQIFWSIYVDASEQGRAYLNQNPITSYLRNEFIAVNSNTTLINNNPEGIFPPSTDISPIEDKGNPSNKN